MFTHDRLPLAFRRWEERPTSRVRADDGYIYGWARWVVAAVMAVIPHAAQTHGNRRQSRLSRYA